MRWTIGFWIISLAFTILIFFVFDTDLYFKEKIKSAFGWMMFITLLLVGVNVMIGGM